MQDIKELRHANEHRYSMTVKRVDDALRRYRRKKYDGCTNAERTKTVRDERKNVRKRKDRQDAMVGRQLKRFAGAGDFVLQIVKGQLHTLRIAGRAGCVNQER